MDRGDLVLAGHVSSEVERVVLGNIARRVAPYGVDNQVKVDGDGSEAGLSGAGAWVH